MSWRRGLYLQFRRSLELQVGDQLLCGVDEVEFVRVHGRFGGLVG